MKKSLTCLITSYTYPYHVHTDCILMSSCIEKRDINCYSNHHCTLNLWHILGKLLPFHISSLNWIYFLDCGTHFILCNFKYALKCLTRSFLYVVLFNIREGSTTGVDLRNPKMKLFGYDKLFTHTEFINSKEVITR